MSEPMAFIKVPVAVVIWHAEGLIDQIEESWGQTRRKAIKRRRLAARRRWAVTKWVGFPRPNGRRIAAEFDNSLEGMGVELAFGNQYDHCQNILRLAQACTQDTMQLSEQGALALGLRPMSYYK